jgi:hypothetical protein
MYICYMASLAQLQAHERDGPTQFRMSITQEEINGMSTKVIEILNYIETNKRRIPTHDQRQLSNHLSYVLNTLGNMSNMLAVDKSDPYFSRQGDYGRVAPARKVVYNPDGTTRIVSSGELSTSGDGWEAQFDEGMLMHPPCYQMPPQNITSIPRIKKATEWNRLKDL